MPIFDYRGQRRGGNVERGEIEASGTYEAVCALTETGVNVYDVRARTSRLLFSGPRSLGVQATAKIVDYLLAAVSAGLPLPQALASLEADVSDKCVRAALGELERRLMFGDSLEEALAASSGGFPPVYQSLIRAGERTGNLAAVLQRLKEYADRAVDTRRRFGETLAYPILLTLITFIVFGFLFTTVLPQFEAIYADVGARMPRPAEICCAAGKALCAFAAYHGTAMAAFGLALLLVVLLLRRLTFVRQVFAEVSERCVSVLPFIRRLHALNRRERFARCLALLVGHGAEAPEALVLAGAAAGGPVYARAGVRAAQAAMRGDALADALDATGLFSKGFVWTLREGERRGDLAAELNALADAYGQTIDRATRLLAAYAGPFLVLLIGIAIGAFAIVMFLPLLRLPAAIPPC